jgi:hypothetical protein
MNTPKILVTIESEEEQPKVVSENEFEMLPEIHGVPQGVRQSNSHFILDENRLMIQAKLSEWKTIRIEVLINGVLLAEYNGSAVNCSTSLGLSLPGIGYLRVFYLD